MEKREMADLKKRLKQAWIKNKILACDVRGLGMGKAMEIAEKLGLDPKVLIFGPAVKEKGETIVGVIYATSEERDDEDYEYARWNSFENFWKDLVEAIGKGEKNIWVRLGTENTETLRDVLQNSIVIRGQYYDEWEHKWKEA